jgi:DNA-binding transcriptional regulator YdaS (Cro superfamily)
MEMQVEGMALIRSKRGLLAKISRETGLSRGGVAKWERVPAERLPQIEQITGIPRQQLRPDICPPVATDADAI